jgi:hypothetical protein
MEGTPSTTITGPIDSSTLDLGIRAAQTAVEASGSLVLGQPRIEGDHLIMDYIDNASCPCDLSRCRGFVPDLP